MLLTKGSAVSNVENTVIGPKTAVLPSGQEVTVTSPTITTPYQYLPTTSHRNSVKPARYQVLRKT